MKQVIDLKNFEGDLSTFFLREISKDKHLLLKKIDGTKFEVVSKNNFGNFNMIEKEFFFIKGEFMDINNQKLIYFKIRGNSTFRTLAVVIPLFTSPLLIFSFEKNFKQENSLIMIMIYLIISGLSVSILLYQEYRMKKQGERYFLKLIEKIKTL